MAEKSAEKSLLNVEVLVSFFVMGPRQDAFPGAWEANQGR